MLIDDLDYHFMLNSLQLQKKLIQDKIEQMQLVENAIESTAEAIQKEQQIDWSRMLELIHLTGFEKSLKSQYQNASNISARIRLHREFSQKRAGFPGSTSSARFRTACVFWKSDVEMGHCGRKIKVGFQSRWISCFPMLPME
jgi:hypothetical protein